MKKLVAPGVVAIPSGMPRTRVGPDSRGPRLCFASLGRSCHDQTGFFNFADGSDYVYSPASNGLAEVLCASPERGRFFNLAIRRALSGYVRGYTPPADYETIYSFPPYAGVQPAQCMVGVLNWNDLSWSVLVNDPGLPAGTNTITTLAGNTVDIRVIAHPGIPGGAIFNSNLQVQGTLSYNGPAVACTLSCVITDLGGPPAFEGFTVYQDATLIASAGTTAFNVADTGGVASTLTVTAQIIGTVQNFPLGPPSSDTQIVASLTPAF